MIRMRLVTREHPLTMILVEFYVRIKVDKVLPLCPALYSLSLYLYQSHSYTLISKLGEVRRLAACLSNGVMLLSAELRHMCKRNVERTHVQISKLQET